MTAEVETEILTRIELKKRAMEHVLARGELVWDRCICIGSNRIALESMWTTRLAREFIRQPLKENEPESRVVGICDDEWRIYLCEGESYSLEGSPSKRFTLPTKVNIKSRQEYIRLKVLPKSSWWEAPFACPFCNTLCVEDIACDHCLVKTGHLRLDLQETEFGELYQKMWNRIFCCNFANANVPGLVVKQNVTLLNTEWFRFCYIYLENKKSIKQIESLLKEVKDR